MSPKAPVPNAGASPGRLVVPAVLLLVVAGGFVVRPALPGNGRKTTAAPAMRLLPPAPQPAGSLPPTLLWSPSLFSLAQEAGFSGFLSPFPPFDAPLQPVGDQPAYLRRAPRMERPSNIVRILEGLRMTTGKGLEESALPDVFHRPSRSFAARVRSEPVIEFSTEIPGSSFDTAPFPVRRPLADGKSWTATAFLEVDAEGVVQQALLETPAPEADVNRDLVNGLYQWRGRPAPGGRRGRITFSHPPAPAAGGPPP